MKRRDDRLDAELRYHIERMIRESIASGMDPQEAERQARLEFGGVEQIKEECRDVRGRWLADLAADLRYAARSLRRSPGFLAVAVTSLALGIGANTAIFSLINAVILQPLPVREPERLVLVTRLMDNGKLGVISYPLFDYFRDNLKTISGTLATMQSRPAIVVDGTEEVVNAEQVSAEYFPVLGLEAAAGRLLEPADQTGAGGPLPAVISYGYWQRRFAGNPQAIGKVFAIRDRMFVIVGVMPPRFQGVYRGSSVDLVLPLSPMVPPSQREMGSNYLNFLARLKPGAKIEQTHAETLVLWDRHLQARASEAEPKNRTNILRQRAGAFSGAAGINRLGWEYYEPLIVLMGIVALVLLLACANLSGLLLARAASRQREISIRLAIGAARGRLFRQFLAEGLVLAALGGAAGLLLSRIFSGALVAMMANGETLLLAVAPDWRVLAFTGAVSLLACVLAGLAPGLHAMRSNINPVLKEGRSGHRRLGRALVVAQLAISMVLVVGAALFIGTLVRLYGMDRGFRSDDVMTFGVRASQRYPEARRLAIQTELVNRLSALPGVISASAVAVLPIGSGLWTRSVQAEGYTFRADESEDAGFNVIAPGYFATIGTPLLRGREFDARDSAAAPKVAIVNESFARYYFGDRPVVGRHVTSLNVVYEIVGVVGDAKYHNLRAEILKTVYIPWMQRPDEQPSRYTYLARTAGGNPMNLTPVLERLVHEVDAGLHLQAPRTYAAVIDQSIVTERIMATLGGFFGVLALVVACLGMFGVIAFQMSRRINELGVRMALGARRGDIVALVLREVAAMVAAGSAIGGVAAFATGGLASRMLFGVTPTEPAVFAISALVLAAAAAGAAWLPARRASRIDPMIALRHE